MEKTTETSIATALKDIASTLRSIEGILRDVHENGVVVCQCIDEDENEDVEV